MNQLLSNPTRICGKCHQELPCEAFYVSQKSQYRDCYCKKCRAESSRLRRKQQPHSSIPDNPKAYLVITLVKNREVRIAHSPRQTSGERKHSTKTAKTQGGGNE